MNARTKEKLYGGMTAEAIRESLYYWAEGPREVVTALLDELEATSASEVVGRLRRIETKLHKLALHTGAEPTNGGETTMTISASMPLVHVSGYDTTLAQIKHVAEEGKVASGATLFILQGEALLGTLRLTGRD